MAEPELCNQPHHNIAFGRGDARGYSYFSFDDAVVLAAATSDPIGFVDDLPLTLGALGYALGGEPALGQLATGAIEPSQNYL